MTDSPAKGDTTQAKSKQWLVNAVYVYIFITAAIALLYALRILTPCYISTEGERTFITTPIYVGDWAASLAMLGPPALLIIGVLRIFSGRFGAGIGTIVRAIICAIIVFQLFMTVVLSAYPSCWTVDRVSGHDGQDYYVLRVGLAGPRDDNMAIAVDAAGFPWRKFEVMGMARAGEHIRLIRPIDDQSKDYRTYVNDAGVIARLWENRCWMAYDTKLGQFYCDLGQENDSEETAYKDLRELSPFLLIGADTRMNQQDVGAVVDMMIDRSARMKKGRGYNYNEDLPFYPEPATLTAALAHPNPTVRELAQRLLDIHQANDATNDASQE